MGGLFPIERGAIFSDPDEAGVRRYRHRLWRWWDRSLPALVCIGLNPSIAGAKTDDSTIKVGMGRGRRLGFGGLIMANAFQLVSTDPDGLTAPGVDPIGPDADRHLMAALAGKVGMVLACWGDGGALLARDADVIQLVTRDCGFDLHCLGVTHRGYPRHPLRIPYEQPPQLWRTKA